MSAPHVDSHSHRNPIRRLARTGQALALCLIGACSLPALAQQTQVYGVAHVSIDAVDNGTHSGTQIASNGSRIGFRGSEDIGVGIRLAWQIESEVDLAGGSSGGFASRNSFIGLAGNHGITLIGRHDTPYKMATARMDPFADRLGDYNAIMGAISNASAFDNRANNIIAYLSPVSNGLSVAFAYVTDLYDDRPGPDANDSKGYSLNFGYEYPPFYLTLAHERFDGVTFGVDEGQGVVSHRENFMATKFGGTYRQGNTTLAAIWENYDIRLTDRVSWYFAARHDFGRAYVAGAFTLAEQFNSYSGTSASLLAAGIGYRFSQDTEVYALYAQLDNGRQVLYALGNGGHGKPVIPVEPGQQVKGLSLGLTHRFF